MMIIFDFLLIFMCSIIAYSSFKRICFEENASVSYYVILILYIFCVIPILFNYVAGIPTYTSAYWYKPFIPAMEDESIGIIYDIYIYLTIFFLYFTRKKENVSKKGEMSSKNNFLIFLRTNKFFSWIIILSPLILIIANGTFSNYLKYSTTQLRGLTEIESTKWVTPLLLSSLVTFFSVYFKDNLNAKKKILSFIYFFVIAWISGKRFIFANIMILILFYTTNMDISMTFRKKIFKTIPILIIFLVGMSGLYLSVIKPAKIESDNSIYDMLRVDFGRDDVIKYVIKKEFYEHDPILEYRGQSFVGLFFELVPRKIWPNKPYPHYMYLTSSILNLSIYNLPAGTTPSWLEMCLCNFYYFGYAIAIFSLCIFCRLLDKTRDVDIKGIGMLLMSVLLTQSMDVYFVVLIVFLLFILFKNLKIKKR